MGLNSDAQLEYGQCPKLREEQLEIVMRGIVTHGAEKMARHAKLSAEQVRKIEQGKTQPTPKTLTRLAIVGQALDGQTQSEQLLLEKVKAELNVQKVPLRTLAKALNLDASNLAKMLNGQRGVNNQQLLKVWGWLEKVQKSGKILIMNQNEPLIPLIAQFLAVIWILGF